MPAQPPFLPLLLASNQHAISVDVLGLFYRIGVI